jgi:hypothetical protein
MVRLDSGALVHPPAAKLATIGLCCGIRFGSSSPRVVEYVMIILQEQRSPSTHEGQDHAHATIFHAHSGKS